jgi:L-alanine-DL-glutamate epimerase-like enolase superfamily enzyme
MLVKITGVEATALANGTCRVEVATDSGIAGMAVTRGDVAGAVRQLGTACLSGNDARAVQSLWCSMQAVLAGGGQAESAFTAAAALDIALWDVKARTAAEPLWRTLGGGRPRVNAYVSCNSTGASTASFEDWCRRMRNDFAIHECRLHLTDDADVDRQRMASIGRIFGEQPGQPGVLMLVAPDGDVRRAVQRVNEIEAAHDLTWLELPEAGDKTDDLKYVSDNIAAAVCAGRALHTVDDFLPCFRARCIDIVQIDLARTGITAALQIADAAYGLELPVTLAATPGDFAAHVAASLPNCMSVEVSMPSTAPLLVDSDICIRDGKLVAGDAPGHGLQIRPDPKYAPGPGRSVQ